MTQQSHSWACIQTKLTLKKTHAPICSLQHYLQQPRHGATYISINRGMHQENVIHIYLYVMEYYSAIKKNEIMPFTATWMELEILILSEVSQKEKDKHHMISLISGI